MNEQHKPKIVMLILIVVMILSAPAMVSIFRILFEVNISIADFVICIIIDIAFLVSLLALIILSD